MFSLHSITLHHRLSIRGIIYTLYMQNIIRMIIGYICIYIYVLSLDIAVYIHLTYKRNIVIYLSIVDTFKYS